MPNEVTFESQAAQKFYERICKWGGDKKEIDTPIEIQRAAFYLHKNEQSLSEGDINLFNNIISTGEANTGYKVNVWWNTEKTDTPSRSNDDHIWEG